MSLITLNGNSGVPQPSELTEEYLHVRRVRTTITGLSRQIWLAQKMQVTMKFEGITQSQFNLLNGYIAGGALISYSNSSSGWSFSGFATSAPDQYIRGASMLRNMTIVILQQ